MKLLWSCWFNLDIVVIIIFLVWWYNFLYIMKLNNVIINLLFFEVKYVDKWLELIEE
jgi:hypothetical protein